MRVSVWIMLEKAWKSEEEGRRECSGELRNLLRWDQGPVFIRKESPKEHDLKSMSGVKGTSEAPDSG